MQQPHPSKSQKFRRTGEKLVLISPAVSTVKVSLFVKECLEEHNLRLQGKKTERDRGKQRAERRMDENGTASTDYYGHGPLTLASPRLSSAYSPALHWPATSIASHNGTRPGRRRREKRRCGGTSVVVGGDRGGAACRQRQQTTYRVPKWATSLSAPSALRSSSILRGENDPDEIPNPTLTPKEITRGAHVEAPPTPIFSRGKPGRARDASHAQERTNLPIPVIRFGLTGIAGTLIECWSHKFKKCVRNVSENCQLQKCVRKLSEMCQISVRKLSDTELCQKCIR